MNAITRETDRGFNRIHEEIKRLEGQSIKVGIQSDAGAEADGTSIAAVAAYNEFGSDRAPSRPFMRTMADTKRGQLYRVATAAYESMLRSGGSAARTLGMVGTWYQDEQKKLLRDGPWIKNAPQTIKQKGSATPLIDSSRLVGSIKYAIVLGHPRL